ncbi:hypothetical protein EGW08_001835 [Elysia chlorotica]|uniref:Uncharacterized protein n=1 Tax=Elysia chlorotica TaxID=188477 RepID=A0A433U9F1_ELYCH|nr:hypothetical protein EGW08_001835 [Elysia chlorotica]
MVRKTRTGPRNSMLVRQLVKTLALVRTKVFCDVIDKAKTAFAFVWLMDRTQAVPANQANLRSPGKKPIKQPELGAECCTGPVPLRCTANDTVPCMVAVGTPSRQAINAWSLAAGWPERRGVKGSSGVAAGDSWRVRASLAADQATETRTEAGAAVTTVAVSTQASEPQRLRDSLEACDNCRIGPLALVYSWGQGIADKDSKWAIMQWGYVIKHVTNNEAVA